MLLDNFCLFLLLLWLSICLWSYIALAPLFLSDLDVCNRDFARKHWLDQLGSRLSVLNSIWKAPKSPWIGVHCSTAMTGYEELPSAKNIVLNRPDGKGMPGLLPLAMDWTALGVRMLQASSPVVSSSTLRGQGTPNFVSDISVLDGNLSLSKYSQSSMFTEPVYSSVFTHVAAE